MRTLINLRQFVDLGLAQNLPDARDAWIGSGRQLATPGRGIGHHHQVRNL